MGREIRRVPLDWEHPRDDRGRYIPQCEQDFESALQEYLHERAEYKKDPFIDDGKVCTFEEVNYGPPNPNAYRRDPWPEGSATGWQFYENVSEGTPGSPVFATADALVEWLSTHVDFFGHGPMKRSNAERLVRHGSAPSLMFSPETGIVRGWDFDKMSPGK